MRRRRRRRGEEEEEEEVQQQQQQQQEDALCTQNICIKKTSFIHNHDNADMQWFIRVETLQVCVEETHTHTPNRNI